MMRTKLLLMLLLLVVFPAFSGCGDSDSSGTDGDTSDGDIDWPSCPFHTDLDPVPLIEFESRGNMTGQTSHLLIYKDKSYQMEKDYLSFDGDIESYEAKPFEGKIDDTDFDSTVALIEEHLPMLPCSVPDDCEDGTSGYIHYFEDAKPEGHSVSYYCNGGDEHLSVIRDHLYWLVTRLIVQSGGYVDGDSPDGDRLNDDTTDGDKVEGNRIDDDLLDGDWIDRDLDEEYCEIELVDSVCIPGSFDFDSFDPNVPCTNEGLIVCPTYDRCECNAYFCRNGEWRTSHQIEGSCHHMGGFCHFLGYDPDGLDDDADPCEK